VDLAGSNLRWAGLCCRIFLFMIQFSNPRWRDADGWERRGLFGQDCLYSVGVTWSERKSIVQFKVELNLFLKIFFLHFVRLYQWCRRLGCKRTPKSLDFVKIRAQFLEIGAKSVKTFAKSLKIWASSPKIRAKMAPNLLWFEKKGSQRVLIWKKMVPEITRRPFVGGHQKYGLLEKIFAQKVAQNFFGQVWRNSGKNIVAPPKICPLLHLWVICEVHCWHFRFCNAVAILCDVLR